MQSKPRNKVFGVLLAAGTGSRFGGGKLAARLDGRALLQHAMQPLSTALAGRLLLVLGHDWQALLQATAPRPGFYVVNDRYADGMGTSLALAVRALRHVADAIVVALADQPDITAAHLENLVANWSGDAQQIVATHASGVDCPPVLFPRGAFDDLAGLSGDAGGRHLFGDARFRLTRLPLEHALRDIDTREDLADRLR